jgi:hypothetical protein
VNYQRIYGEIIERARCRTKPACYCERHHVIPKSMGGNDAAANLVWLTAREHYIAHWLLFKAHRTQAMAFAWYRMTHGRNLGRYVSHTYAYAQAARAAATSSLFKGARLTEEHRQKLQAAKRGKTYAQMGRSQDSPLRGRRASAEHRAKVSAASKGRRHTDDTRQKMRASKLGEANPRFGKETSQATKLKIAEAIRVASKARTTAVLLTIDGVTDNIAGWSRHPACEVGSAAITARLRVGWVAEDAVFIPPLPPRKHSAEELIAIRDLYRAKLKALRTNQNEE